MVSKCPGQNTQFWGPGDIFTIECPKCGNGVEFFKDDIRRRCQSCSHMFINPRLNLGCAGWCQYADQCVGTIGKEELKDILTSAIKEYFQGDEEKIDHALKVLRFAEKILETEEGNPKVVISAAILYDIGIYEYEKDPERVHVSDQGGDGLSAVRGILERSGIREETREEICGIIAAHSYLHQTDFINSKIVYDAVQLADLSGPCEAEGKKGREKTIKKTFFTPTGKKMAEEIYYK